uniref:Uncharacterized protein n=1 Tax=Ditylenchus dipsaci TaxID=166011 RepID=A0A915DDF6_9BILA
MATSGNANANSSAPTIPSPIAPSLNSTIPVDFPFNFLHAEMVRHFRVRDAEIADKKAEWLQHVKDSDFADALVSGQHKDGQQVTSQIFAHGNADTRLESIGYRVGYVLVERIAKDVPRLTSELETMKFICKEFWTTAFGKGWTISGLIIRESTSFRTTNFTQSHLSPKALSIWKKVLFFLHFLLV